MKKIPLNISRNQCRLIFLMVWAISLYCYVQFSLFNFTDPASFNSEKIQSFINNTLLSSMWRFCFGATIYVSTWFAFFGLLLFKNWGRTCFAFSLIAGIAMELLWWSHLSGLDLMTYWMPFFFKGLMCLLIYCTDVSLHFDKKTQPIRSLLYLAVVYGFLNVAIWGLQIDDDLEPSAASLLEDANPKGESDAYYYFLGIDAPPDKSPFDAGREISGLLSKAEQAYLASKNPKDYLAFWGDIHKLSDGYRFDFSKGCEIFNCYFKDDNWVHLILSDRYDPSMRMGAVEQLSLKRYQYFLNLDDYKTLHKSFYFSYDGPINTLKLGNRLIVLTALDMARDADANAAVNFLIKNIDLLRKQLERADLSRLKLIYTQHISNNIDVISYLMRNNKNHNDIIFPALTLDEKKTRLELAREFSSNLNAMNHDVSKQLLKWHYPVLYKENMMANAIHKSYLELINLSSGSPEQFAAAVKTWQSMSPKAINHLDSVSDFKQFPVQLKTNIFRHYAGIPYMYNPFFNQKDTVDVIARMFDLDVKIALFNQVMRQRNNAELDLNQIQNPYGGGGAHYEDDKNRICLSGPFNDDIKMRCLWLGKK